MRAAALFRDHVDALCGALDALGGPKRPRGQASVLQGPVAARVRGLVQLEAHEQTKTLAAGAIALAAHAGTASAAGVAAWWADLLAALGEACGIAGGGGGTGGAPRLADDDAAVVDEYKRQSALLEVCFSHLEIKQSLAAAARDET
jgi:hypothetical protein